MHDRTGRYVQHKDRLIARSARRIDRLEKHSPRGPYGYLRLSQTTGSIQNIPTGTTYTQIAFEDASPPGIYNPNPDDWQLDLVSGFVVAVHALNPGFYICKMAGDWGSPSGDFKKEVNLSATIQDITYFQTPAIQTTYNAVEDTFDIVSFHRVPEGFDTATDNTIACFAKHGNGSAVEIQVVSMEILQVQTEVPLP